MHVCSVCQNLVGGYVLSLKKKRIPTVLGPTKRLVSLVNSEVYFTELFQKIRYQYFECNDSHANDFLPHL